MNTPCTTPFPSTGARCIHLTSSFHLKIQRPILTGQFKLSTVASLLKNKDASPYFEAPKSFVPRLQAPSSHNLVGHVNVNANVGFQHTKIRAMPPAEQALFSIAFILCTTLGLFSSMLIIALPTLNSFRRLSRSMQKLSNVIQEEVPGTLASFKLSGIEINDLTQQLSNLRQRLQGGFFRRKDKSNKPSSRKERDNPIFQ